MEIPRGTFREIRKGQDAGALLEELAREHFSGVCTLVHREVTGSLVLDSGICILAAYGPHIGDRAIEGIHGIAGLKIDAALSVLTPAQIRLSLEFNQKERVKNHGILPARPVKSIVLPQYPGSSLSATVSPAIHKSPVIHKENKEKHPAILPRMIPSETVVFHRSPVIDVKRKTRPGDLSDIPKNSGVQVHPVVLRPETGEGNDLDGLDDLNLETMSGQLQKECRTLVKRIDLEYLMDRD
ncbi:MAG: hypothetical protein LUQ31_04280 [Methanoregula sp.]|nr:hypothetical protein [Methanoregula sp.]